MAPVVGTQVDFSVSCGWHFVFGTQMGLFSPSCRQHLPSSVCPFHATCRRRTHCSSRSECPCTSRASASCINVHSDKKLLLFQSGALPSTETVVMDTPDVTASQIFFKFYGSSSEIKDLSVRVCCPELTSKLCPMFMCFLWLCLLKPSLYAYYFHVCLLQS